MKHTTFCSRSPSVLAVPLMGLMGLVAAGCHEHDSPADHAAEACEHLMETATPVSGTASPPADVVAHKRYEVALGDVGTGGKTGTVKVAIAQAGHLMVFLSADVPVKVTNPNGGELTAGEVKKSGLPCNELKAWYEYEVGVGSQQITVGGAAVSAGTIGLVIETEVHEH